MRENFQKTSVFLKVFLKKCFHRNNAGSLKLTVAFSVGGFQEIAKVYSHLF